MMEAKRSAQQSVAHKVFVRSTKTGKAHKIFREQYLRDDIVCGSTLCPECGSKSVQDYKGDLLPPVLSGSEICVVDTNICLKAIDLLEHPLCFTDVVVPHTVLEEVRNRSISVYTRLRALTSTSRQSEKRFYVYHNEFSSETFANRENCETVNDYNDRLIRRVAEFYKTHLPSVNVVLVSNDKLNLQAARKSGLNAINLRDYVKSVNNEDLLDLVSFNDAEDGEDGENGEGKGVRDNALRTSIYPAHLSTSAVLTGLKNQTLFQGTFHVSTYNYLESSVTIPGFDKKLLVLGKVNANRAFDGDLVAVSLLPKSEWRTPVNSLETESTDAGFNTNDDDLNDQPLESAKERLLLLKSLNKQKGDDEDSEAVKARIEPTCKVESVIKRNWRFYVGTISSDYADPTKRDSGAQRSVLVKCMDRRIPPLRIRTKRPNGLANQRLVVAVDNWPAHSPHPVAHFVRCLGPSENHQTETEAILLEHDIEFRPFPQAAIDCLPAAGDAWVPSEADLRNRRDLRDLTICSIDPPNCQDIDDALHAYKLPNGNFSVGVHIADVTNFVKPDTALDREGQLRATSTYLVDRRIDMLPALLGTNLCSLKPYVERCAFSVLWEITSDGEIVNTEFTKSLIKSRKAFEYTEAQSQHDDVNSNDEISQSLRILMAISKKLKQKRIDAGALNLASPEVKIVFGDELNDPEEVKLKPQVDTNSLVEEFMLLANISVARQIYASQPQTAMLRRHPEPPATNFDVLNDQLRLKGYKSICTDSSKSIADSLNEIVDKKDSYFNTLLRILATRCMTSAEYFSSGSCAYAEFKHYGLATDIYTHFTSPIRRYADIIVHRQLAASINYEHLASSQLMKSNIDLIAENNNKRHRNAQMAGRASVEYFVGKMLKSQNSIKELQGYVVRVFSNGLGVLVPEYGLESVIKFDDDEIAEFDESNYTLRLKTRSVSVFDKVQVSVESVLQPTGKRSVKMCLV